MNAWVEEVTETVGGHIVASSVRKATSEEIESAEKLHADGKCPHTIIADEDLWPYYLRRCVTCRKDLGLI